MSTEIVARTQLAMASSGWSIGALGALAEFERDEDERAVQAGTAVVTARGAIGLDLHPRTRAIAYELPSARADAWLHGIALCLPSAASRMHGRSTITETGRDADALRQQDRDSILFDLGLDSEYFDFHVRTGDRAQINVLRDAVGRSLLDEPGLVAEIANMSPHRVFVSALGRIEACSHQALSGAAPAV